MKRRAILPAVAATTVLLTTAALAVAPASAAVPTCFGEPATIVGTRGDDVLKGTDGRDVIAGLRGNDVIRGRAGNDLLCGGAGIDYLYGGSGRDKLSGDEGYYNEFEPGPGNDYVDGGPGPFDDINYFESSGPIDASLADGVATGEGTDTIENVEQIIGSLYDDILEGDDGPNWLIGMDGDDQLVGLGGDDDFAPGPGDDAMDGGEGTDFADYYMWNAVVLGQPLEGPVTVDFPSGTATGEGNDTLTGIEGASGSLGDDTMIGDAEDNTFAYLFEGDDTVDAGDGDDVVDGGEGVDDLDGGGGTDTLSFADSSAGITADLAEPSDSDGDVLAGFEDVEGSLFDDTISGDDGPNRITGLDGDDVLAGLGGDDALIGDDGADSANGGLGSDECDAETETACEAEPDARRTVIRLQVARQTLLTRTEGRRRDD